MTNKTQAIFTAWIAGVSSFLAWLVSLPPENQDALIKPMIELTPLDWRPAIGLASRALATATTIYAVYRAAHSGPNSPPRDAVMK